MHRIRRFSGSPPARALVLAALLLALAGCGRRGPPEAPPDPSAAAAAAEDGTALIGHRPKKVPIARPAEPFILDPLL